MLEEPARESTLRHDLQYSGRRIAQLDVAEIGTLQGDRGLEYLLENSRQIGSLDQTRAQVVQTAHVFELRVELGLDALAIRDIANCSDDQEATAALDGAQADLDGKFAAVLAPAEELQPHAHRSQANALAVFRSMLEVARVKALRHEDFHGVADHLLTIVSEDRADLTVREPDDARLVNDDHGVGSGVQRAARQFRRN